MFDPISIAAIVAGGAGLASGVVQSGAQDRATQAQTQGNRDALNLQTNQWNTTQKQIAPYLQYGEAALPEMQRIAGEAGNIDPASDAGYKPINSLQSPGEFQFNTTGPNADPSYQWRLNQGLAGVESSAAARGGYFGGNTGKALMDYGQGSASQEYGNQFGRYNQMWNNYMGQEGFNADQYGQAYGRQMGMNQNEFNQQSAIAGMGANAVNASSNAGNQFSTNAGNIAMNQGNTMANNATNQAGIWGNVISNASNQFMSGWGQQQQIDQMNNQWQKPTSYYQDNNDMINNLKL